jgi:hypothetical protein
MNKGFFFLSFFQFCNIKSLENFPQKIAKLVEFTLAKQIIMNYFVKNETKFVKRSYEQGVFSFFLSFQFCDIKSLEKFPKKIAKVVELTLNKQNIMNYFVKNETKNFKKQKKL